MRHDEPDPREADRQLIDIQRMRIFQKPGISGKFARMDHHRDIELFGQLVIRIVARIVQRHGVVAGIQFQTQTFFHPQHGSETLQ